MDLDKLFSESNWFNAVHDIEVSDRDEDILRLYDQCFSNENNSEISKCQNAYKFYYTFYKYFSFPVPLFVA